MTDSDQADQAQLPQCQPLEQHDPELYDIIEREKTRQWSCLELIASENFTSRAVMECLGSCLTNKYAEGLPHRRYYGGNEFIDQVEQLCQTRALAAYGLDSEKWGVNVQPYSGSPANFAVYTGLLKPHERIMGLDLPSGGHLTHGYYTYSKKSQVKLNISATSKYFESMPYRVSAETGRIDYDELEKHAALFKPALIVAGGSAYPREWDYSRFRDICDSNGALLMCDMAHISGLVATGEARSPFDVCDIVTTTTHKSLRGPRAGMIFFRKDNGKGWEKKINDAVFPALQGGPHEHQIAGMYEVMTPEFKQYAKQVRANARVLAECLTKEGFSLCSGGTDNHLILWDLRPQKVTGSKMEKVCDMVGITLNKNAVLGDRSAVVPGGVRIGTPALTTRGFKESDFQSVADLLMRTSCSEIQKTAGKQLRDFLPAARAMVQKKGSDLWSIRQEASKLATSFPMPGINTMPKNLRYQSLDQAEAVLQEL